MPSAPALADANATLSQAPSTTTATTQSTTTQSTAAATSTAPATHLVKGYIDQVSSAGFHINGGYGVGYIWVYTNSTTHKAYGTLTPRAGEYAVAVGTGSLATSLTATYAALYSSTVSAQTLTGQLASSQAYGYSFRLSSGQYVPLAMSSTTSVSGSLALWHSISVSAIGSTSTGFVALSINGSAAATSAPAPVSVATAPPSAATATVPKHLLTSEYLQGLYGTFSVSPTQAAQYLSWAQTTIQDANGIHNAGIKTQIYVDPNWLAPTDPMYAGSIASDWAYTCGGSHVTIAFGTAASRYDTNPNSSTEHTHFATWVNAQKALGHIDMIFEDNPGPLSPYAKYPNGMPCSYSPTSWINGTIALDNSVSVPVMVNGLNAFVTPSLAPNVSVVLGGSNTIGGDMEGCYNDVNKPIDTGGGWAVMEQTELEVTNAGKLFECMGRDANAASSSSAGRIFQLASFLLTYKPANAIFESEWATPSHFRVMPESGLVALNPRVAAPSSFSSLKQPSGAYGREYANCYYRGTSVGACAVAVTHDYGAPHPFPFSGYTHTLVVSGNGVTDGGTVSFSGPPPPTTMQPYTAVIAFK